MLFIILVVAVTIVYSSDTVVQNTTHKYVTTTRTNGTTTPAPNVYQNKTKCYPFVGCFDNFAPFDNAALDLPQSPEQVGTKMQLFTRINRQQGQFVNFTDMSTITRSHFSSVRKTKFIIHGFSNHIKTPWLYEMKDELLKLVRIFCIMNY
jgi:hypothetical protein